MTLAFQLRLAAAAPRHDSDVAGSANGAPRGRMAAQGIQWHTLCISLCSSELTNMKSVHKFFAVIALMTAAIPLGAADCCPPIYTADQCLGQCSASEDCGDANVCDDGQCIVTCDPNSSSRRNCSGETPTCSSTGDLSGICVCDESSCDGGRTCNATTGNCEGTGEGEGEGEGE
jgi:hypothetical protein